MRPPKIARQERREDHGQSSASAAEADPRPPRSATSQQAPDSDSSIPTRQPSRASTTTGRSTASNAHDVGGRSLAVRSVPSSSIRGPDMEHQPGGRADNLCWRTWHAKASPRPTWRPEQRSPSSGRSLPDHARLLFHTGSTASAAIRSRPRSVCSASRAAAATTSGSSRRDGSTRAGFRAQPLAHAAMSGSAP